MGALPRRLGFERVLWGDNLPTALHQAPGLAYDEEAWKVVAASAGSWLLRGHKGPLQSPKNGIDSSNREGRAHQEEPMVRQVWLLSGLMLPFGPETYHAACLAFDSVNKAIYISEPFEKECAGQVASCRSEVVSKWTAFLRKEGLAQTPGAPAVRDVQCRFDARRVTPLEGPEVA